MEKLKIFLFVLLTFGMLGTFKKPVQAISILQAFQNMGEFVGALTDEDGENMMQLVSRMGIATSSTVLSTLCTEEECIGEVESMGIRNSPNLPEGIKLGLLGVTDKAVTGMFQNQPQINVVAHLAEEWIPGYEDKQSVYASGYDDLVRSNIGGLWSFTRNIAYVGFVIVIIVIGFMIMFRNKIGGQVMVTVGNTIPRVIVALVLVTFSFAIVGLILDITGLLMRVAIGTFGGVDIHNIWSLLTGTVISTGTEFATGPFTGIVIMILAIIPGGLLSAGIWTLILTTITVILIVWGGAKLWFQLVKAYLGLLVNLITAPLVIMAGSLPGNTSATANLFKSVLRNALVFPVAYIIVNLPYALMVQDNKVNLAFPESVAGTGTSGLPIGDVILGITRILAIYIAAQTPEFLKSIIPPTASRSGADVGGAIKAGLSKMPLLGGLFGK